MKFNIKPSDARYIVDEKNKTVVCIIDKTAHLFTDFVDDNLVIGVDCDELYSWRHNRNYNASFKKKLVMPNRFTGIARCSNDDEWNVDTGKLIAFSRAKDKVNKSFFKRANTYVDFLESKVMESIVTLNQVGEKLTVNTEHRHNLIESLIGSEDVDKNGVQEG